MNWLPFLAIKQPTTRYKNHNHRTLWNSLVEQEKRGRSGTTVVLCYFNWSAEGGKGPDALTVWLLPVDNVAYVNLSRTKVRTFSLESCPFDTVVWFLWLLFVTLAVTRLPAVVAGIRTRGQCGTNCSHWTAAVHGNYEEIRLKLPFCCCCTSRSLTHGINITNMAFELHHMQC